MTAKATRGLCAALLTTTVIATAAACSDGGTGASDTASRAASAAASAASRGADVVASATAAAGEKLKNFKNGVDATSDVELSSPDVAADGRTTTEVTVDNSTDATKSYAIQVNFRDPKGKLLDVVVVTVDDVASHTSKKATARSNRKLSGEVKAETGAALRH
ncbi:hypothetical protein ACFCV8_31690 [Streptomyces sp. NPDC056347]|uniref:hypothetical protein n=1 Tax=Streptomyces sp. NPDC056347 TaxID=3345790 RepID=UPI0035DB3BF0